MVRRKDPIVVFGTGAGARRAVACMKHRCRVDAFVDNDTKKRGLTFLGRRVVGPGDLTNFPGRKICVASMYADQIYRQLTEHLAVDPARIIIVRKEVLEGAFEVSPWTYAVLSIITVFAISVLGGVGLVILRAFGRG